MGSISAIQNLGSSLLTSDEEVLISQLITIRIITRHCQYCVERLQSLSGNNLSGNYIPGINPWLVSILWGILIVNGLKIETVAASLITLCNFTQHSDPSGDRSFCWCELPVKISFKIEVQWTFACQSFQKSDLSFIIIISPWTNKNPM